MNPVLMLVHNSLDLTRKAVMSVLDQDIKTDIYVVDNDSDKETQEFLASFSQEWHVRSWRRHTNGVSSAWNFGLNYLFNVAQCEHVLVINNDVELMPQTYRALLADGGSFVTAVSVGDLAQLEWDGVTRKRPHPDFSCFLLRREVWQTVGPFDESMVLYASDGDYHLRMHRAGIEAYTIGVPFYHYASGTLKTASETERTQIHWQADQDRDTFERKWGCKVGSPQYYKLFGTEAP